jgi:hypothetical protein
MAQLSHTRPQLRLRWPGWLQWMEAKRLQTLIVSSQTYRPGHLQYSRLARRTWFAHPNPNLGSIAASYFLGTFTNPGWKSLASAALSWVAVT